ncbi:S8 family serine peptidase [Natrialba asiatica]|uniref:Subtilase family protein n=1 Tax=Natrialba asiatica (strain ATCC 700177 / DSM 12278 / JCM 9576 / FERM P-10747 / NBRC 102637 / 172P1) TaxID=29540 RepID=M0AQ79_NATA1|nr:S8 family serine peptidase [Natrialba asiatica]ELY99513.1 subtilase family protein [Natrialba asiatica DSM 12278]
MVNDNFQEGDEHRIDRRTTLKLASVVGLGAVFSGTTLADTNSVDDVSIDPERSPPWENRDDLPDRWAQNRWFVELDTPPTARGGNVHAHASERANLRAQARREEAQFTEQFDYTTLWNGLSVDADLATAITVSTFESVNAVYPVAIVDHPEPEDASPALDTALEMTGAATAQSELGYSGAGQRVAVVDTGIDYNHPDLGGSGNQNGTYTAVAEHDRTVTDPDGEHHPRISHGWDYVGEGFDASDPATSEPNPNPDPMDRQGHGTHVAGIVGADAAAEDGVSGVAPDTALGAYKIFDVGSSSADIIVAALEDAYEDGMDIVNMSLGATLAWGQEYPTTAASNELVAQGVVVVNSAGNDGGLGTWSMSAPANGHDIISVASAENTHLEAQLFGVDHRTEPVPYLEMTGAERPPTEGESAPLALPSASELEGESGYFGCDSGDFDEFPEGHVALIERGHCSFAQKYLNAVEAGATGVVIYNNVSGLFSGTVQDAGVDGVWSAGLSDTDGQSLAALLEDGTDVSLEFTSDAATVPNPNGGLLSDFSSYGQDVELEFGPSVTAPGGLITSTYPLALDEYAMLSGTSMSAPHVAGAVALLCESESGLDPVEVRDRLQNTAEPAPWSLAPDLGLDHSFRQGAGMIQIDEAIEANHGVSPGQIAVGDGAGTDATVTIRNDGDEEIVYSIAHVGAIGTAGNTFAPSFYGAGSTLEAPETVAVPAGGAAEVDVHLTAPAFGLPNHQYGGYIEFDPTDETAATLRVPYAGYDGDYHELPLFGYYESVDEFVEQEPRVSAIVGEDEDGNPITEPVEEGYEFTVAEGDYPIVEAFFGHFPREMRIYAVDQKRGHEYLAMEDRYLSRSDSPDTYYEFPWMGLTQAGESDNMRPVPKGTYTLRVEVLHALGEPENEDHWETWQSPEFDLDTRRVGGRTPVSTPAFASADE